ncbi:MAG: hypothetical protein VX206_03315 [Pseudomonadota bacterium]|nr:hypothetical protein [Pseudomonadota bacterium]
MSINYVLHRDYRKTTISNSTTLYDCQLSALNSKMEKNEKGKPTQSGFPYRLSTASTN